MKRIVGILLALLMLFSLISVTAFAADPQTAPPTTGSIRIWKEQFPDTHFYDSKYRLYLIFPASIAFDEEGKVAAISYRCTDDQKALDGFSTYFTADEANNVSPTAACVAADGRTLSAEAVQWMKNNITKLGTRIRYEGDYNFANESSSPYVYVDGLEFGYYYVDSSTGSAAILDTTTPDIQIWDKNFPPAIKKTITNLTIAEDPEDRNRNQDIKADAHQATVQMGETVQYNIHVTAREGAENYAVMDSQDPGLTLDESSIRITATKADKVVDLTEQCTIFTAANPQRLFLSYGEPETVPYQNTPVYTITVNKGLSRYDENMQTVGTYTRTWSDDFHYGTNVPENNRIIPTYAYNGVNFAVIFPEDWLKTVDNSTSIDITYDCVVNAEATVAQISWGYGRGNSNTAYLFYGHGDSVTDGDSVYPCRLMIFKYEGNGDSSSSTGSRPLQGVEFVLTDADGRYYKLNDSTYAQAAADYSYYRGKISWVNSITDATKLVTSEQGYIVIDGLTNGTYTLKETKALPGYNPAKDIQIVINNQNNTWPELKYQVNIANKTGTLLPNTGGPGVALYYLIGVSLVVCTAAVLARKKKVNG